MSDADIMRYTADELRAMRARGESRSDWARIDATTEEELEASIRSDPDWADVPENWMDNAVVVVPGRKKLLSLRLNAEVVEWFRSQGPGYQTRINAVLEAYMRARRGG